MPRYVAQVDLWISHESRMVRAGDEFETTFPAIGGKPFRLGENVKPVDVAPKSEQPSPDGKRQILKLPK